MIPRNVVFCHKTFSKKPGLSLYVVVVAVYVRQAVAKAGLNGLARGEAHNFPAQIARPDQKPEFTVPWKGRQISEAELAGFSKFLTILDPVLPCLATIGWPLLINCGSKTTAAGAPAVNV